MALPKLEFVAGMDEGFEQDIRKFKVELCDETSLIADALRRDFSDFVIDPILDVGAGFQSISVRSFPGHDVTLLDKIDYGATPHTKRITGDFFEYLPGELRPKTLLLCHVLQYIDDDLRQLHRKISQIRPLRIVTVTNDNDGQFGDIIRWAKKHIPSANPEVHVPMEDIGYAVTRRTHIGATLACKDFESLSYYVGRLILDLSISTSRSKALCAYMESLLTEPTLRINQTILGYEKSTPE